MSPYVLSIDEEACWGCKTCEVACKQEMKTPDGVKLISVGEDGPREINGRPHFRFTVTLCRHCDDPPCAEACPEDAMIQREDGIVILDEAGCTGCGVCLEVCPYDAIQFDSKKGTAVKCNLCHHRVDVGLLPACADNVCLARCIHFGNPAEKGWGA